MIRILRPAGDAGLISGRVFDDVFASSLAPDPAVEVVEARAWLRSIFGDRPAPDDPATHAAWRRATDGFELLGPNYRLIPIAPLLAYVRNRSGSPIRLMLVAHAPGAYSLEWALLRPLLRPGDVLVAPTLSAARVIEFLVPELAAFTRHVPHPIPPLAGTDAGAPTYLASLTRVHPSKLLHRQIEAMALLRERGARVPPMRIAGPLHEPGRHGPSAYARSLAAKIRRLGLEGSVELVGEITGGEAKQRFLAESRLLLNLSITIEESFGKSIAEALGVGVPVLATQWDGFPETVGAGGRCVPVSATQLGMDVPAERIADAIEALLADPPAAEVCRHEALRFAPSHVRGRYREVLEEALASAGSSAATDPPPRDLAAAPQSGLLAATAPLGQYAWAELFELQVAEAGQLLVDGPPDPRGTAAGELRGLLLSGTHAPLSRLLAGARMHGADSRTAGTPVASAAGGLSHKVAAGAMAATTLASRLACLSFLTRTGDAPALRRALAALHAEEVRAVGVTFFEVEALRLEGKLQPAFATCLGDEDEDEDEAGWGELAADRVHQLAVVAREWGRPGMALPWLREWLEQFPDAPDAAMLHLDRCANAAALGLTDEAAQALEAARALVDESVDLGLLEAEIGRAQAPPWSAIAERLGPIVGTPTPIGRGGASFLVETAAGRRVVKRVPSDRDPDRLLELLAPLAQDRCCPRPLGLVRDGSSGYALLEWVDGSSTTSTTIDAAAWRSIVELLERLRGMTAPPDWPLESSWLDRLARNLADERAASFVLAQLRATVPGGPRSLAHGDFSLQNLVWSPAGVVLIDWEQLGGAPLGFDAGWLLAHARVGAGPGPHEQVLDGLLAAGFERASLRWFEMLGLLRLLHRARSLAMEPELRAPVLAAMRRIVDDRARRMGWDA